MVIVPVSPFSITSRTSPTGSEKNLVLCYDSSVILCVSRGKDAFRFSGNVHSAADYRRFDSHIGVFSLRAKKGSRTTTGPGTPKCDRSPGPEDIAGPQIRFQNLGNRDDDYRGHPDNNRTQPVEILFYELHRRRSDHFAGAGSILFLAAFLEH
jgi:hypothetical protein